MTNVYRIGVTLAMASNGPQVLGAISRMMTGVHAQTGQLTGGFNKLKLAIGGAVAMGAGLMILKGFKGPLEEAAKFQTEVAKFRAFGMGDAMTSQAVKFARGANIVGSSARDMMRIVNEAQGAFRESGETDPRRQFSAAQMVAPQMAKLNLVQRTLFGMNEGALHQSNLAAYKFIEQRGGLADPAKFNAIMDNALKVYATSGGQVTFQQLRNFMSTAGVAGRGMSDRALYGMAEPLIAELGGQRAGTSLMTAFSRMNGLIKLPNQALGEYMRLGLWDRSAIELNSMGGLKKVKAGMNPLRNAGEYADNPFAYYEKYILPKYAGQGYNQAQRDRENVMLFGRTGGAAFSLVDRQLPLMHRSVDAQAKALGLTGNFDQVSNTIAGKRIELEKRWQTLQLQIGEKILPMAINGLTMFNSALSKISSWAEAHPVAMKVITQGVVVLGVAMVALGGIALVIAAGAAIFAAGTVGVVIAGITATVAVVGTLIALNWSSLVHGFRMVYDTFAFMVAHPLKFLTTPIRDLPAAIADNAAHPGKPGPGFGGWGARGFASTWGGSTVPPANGNAPPIHVTTNLNVDGKRMATVVSRHQADGLASVGAPRFDPNAGLPSAGAGINR